MSNEPVYIVDDLLCAPGRARDVIERYRSDYVPGAEARGMTLERVLVSPPVWLDDQPNRVLITWTVPGAAGWWGMSAQSRFDPAAASFWKALDELLIERNRYFACAQGDVEALCDV